MPDTWGNLEQPEIEALRPQARLMSETELAERFQHKDNKVIFRCLRKTDRAMAGILDIDYPSQAEATGLSPEAAIDFEGALSEEVEAYEIAEITLIPPEEFDYTPEITDADRTSAQPIDAAVAQFSRYYVYDKLTINRDAVESEAETAELPAIIDHRPNQSPVKDQGERGTCVSHAAMGLLEAFAHIPDDLSEQYTHYKFNEFLGRPHNQDAGLKTTDSAPFLARNDGRICLESHWPYIPNQETINAMVANGTYSLPQSAINNQTYGINAYKIIGDSGLTGESIKNTRYLEALLYQSYNIVVGVWVSWDDKDNNSILDPVLDSSGKPIGQGGHAMLIVGYNRTEEYFIVKNSWRNTWGHNGYAYLHYNFIRTCAKYGYVVDSVIPAAPPSPLPGKLANAPYNAAKLSRASLRSAVVFFKTSQGRFAVAEVYAGDNLYLRNIRVYNANGSIHLEKDSLVIRGTYLCDLDTGRETSTDADFWWEAVSPGVNFLVPRNGASVCIGYNLAALSPNQISNISLSSAPVPSSNLQYAVIVGRTTTNRRFKLLAHMKSSNQLQLSSVEVFNGDGSRYKYGTGIMVPSSWTYNLDTLQVGGGTYADIWWHVISDNVGFLESYSSAKTQLIWCL